MRGRHGLAGVVAGFGALALVVGLSACGETKTTDTAKPGALEGKGPITLATGKDTSGYLQGALDKWNSSHPNEQVRLIELPESADQQRQQMIQNAQTKSDAYTVLNTDVVWTAEFAANGWIEQLPEDQFALDKMLKGAVETTKYFNKLYAAPYLTDAGMLYYRKDLLDAAGITAPPKTWDELKSACQKVAPQAGGAGCYGGQFEKYEGLTCNFSEAVASAGANVVDDQGKPALSDAKAKQGLDFLVKSFQDGTIPKEGITYKEEEGRRAFQEGKLIFHRQWPYQYAKANATDGSSKVAGKFAVAPLPGLTGPGKATLGGHNLAISKFGKNKGTALEFIKFLTSEAEEKVHLQKTSEAPVYAALYDDPELVKQFPYLPVLKDAVGSAVPRPRIVKYNDATTAIQDEAYAALTGTKSSEQALKDLQTKLTSIVGNK
ncbi:ABC transporter substrate-binding protein [Planosporangium mesophilum]|uniref:ABC transporter substrate-binding protein n=1 Tax=Planosporangium mesophilum TaxID=689768 RepID=A0A8J3WXV4_9ACTN|nr:ABC transporter substrate-binding protein [Planosporangium mesophilum]NJC81694.1 ABC transporter substrate-binding protein [Planosporangium mesophilum]GII20645.1 ABC transporter substrate-binding protein [Planosporangium mesophilum]